MSYDMYDAGFGMFGILFFTVWILFLVVFITVFVKIISTWKKNYRSPRLTVDATVVSRRTDITHHRHRTGEYGYHTSSFTSYYATFEFESGDRMVFSVSASEYAMLADGDIGKLSFQGTRFLRFDRI